MSAAAQSPMHHDAWFISYPRLLLHVERNIIMARGHLCMGSISTQLAACNMYALFGRLSTFNVI
jgi:hypothetical protein